MRRRDFYWSLYHLDEKNQMDDLKTDQVEAIFAALPKSMHPNWLIWKEGFDSWKSFDDFPSLLMSLRSHPVAEVDRPPEPRAEMISDILPMESKLAHSSMSSSPSSSPSSSSESASSVSSSKQSSSSTNTKISSTTNSSISKKISAKTSDTAGSKKTAEKSAPNRDKAVSRQNDVLIPESRKRSGEAEDQRNVDFDAYEMRTRIVEIGKAGALSRVNTIDPANFKDQTISLTLDKQQDLDERAGVRYAKRMEARIVTPGIQSKHWTIDLSLSGIKFEGKLPKNLPKYFNVELKWFNTIIPLICSVAIQDGNRCEDRVKIEVNDQIKVLQALLLATG
jgi:hypothetical protein